MLYFGLLFTFVILLVLAKKDPYMVAMVREKAKRKYRK
jgi:hypothetical protein